jgi:hypothetical protein
MVFSFRFPSFSAGICLYFLNCGSFGIWTRALKTPDSFAAQTLLLTMVYALISGPQYLSRYSNSLRAGRFGARTPVIATDYFFSTSVERDPGNHPVSCKMDSFPGSKQLGRGFFHPSNLAPMLRMSGSIPLNPSVPARHVMRRLTRLFQ